MLHLFCGTIIKIKNKVLDIQNLAMVLYGSIGGSTEHRYFSCRSKFLSVTFWFCFHFYVTVAQPELSHM